ncbi:MAG: hypothetical protein HETSPECPRED_000576 [Heterodermia speciosa]|uniref:Uncharacterized protein n=1 Tax=Heterodermia speciosa TaxID=116794 RepID=A0A8H3G822_9LECA|nr:MAG: hypothetical protein HETSPECPRED_000576 [Heterodermia speciosa]
MSPTNTISTSTTDSHTNENAAQQKAARINISSQSTPRQQSPKAGLRPKRPENAHNAGSFLGDLMDKPRDDEKHSKVPYFLRLSGSITPRMLVPLLFVAAWATAITCISEFVYPLVVNSLLLTVLGFVVGLGISFRTSSAYERYIEGRKYWAQLSQISRDLARHIWIHADERHSQSPELGKADLLAKLTALNLIVAFAVSLKHKLRFEPYAYYDDLESLVSHLSTFAGEASDPEVRVPRSMSSWKVAGQFLGLTLAESNPRKQIKRSKKNLGNLPLEILTYLSAYTQSIMKNGTFDNGPLAGTVLALLNNLSDVLAGTERVLSTPLPEAYSIAISQITWVYVIALPFQLWDSLRWVTIPGTVVGAYIVLGIAAIGREIENPFGLDANDLPLDKFCNQLASEINVIASRPPPRPEDFINTKGNKVLYSLNYEAWHARSEEDIRGTLKSRGMRKVELNNPNASLVEKAAQGAAAV